MHKKFMAGAISALLLLNPLSAVAVSTTTSTQTGETSNTDTSNTTKEIGTSESTTTETVASTGTSETATSESQANTTTSDSAVATETTDSSNPVTTTSSTDGGKAEKAAGDTKVVGAFTAGTGKTIDPTDGAYFQKNLAKNYPLGIGTRFTAFAGDTIYFSGNHSPIFFDGTYAASKLNMAHYGVGYYTHSDDYADPNTWNYPFSYATTDGTKPLVLIGNTYDGDKAANALTSLTNFEDQQSFLFEGNSSEIAANNEGSSEARTPVQGKVGDVVDFRDNLGTIDANTLYPGTTYFEQSKKQLNTVSQYYQAFTDTIPAVGNSSIDASIESAKYGIENDWLNEIQVDVPLISGSTKNGVALFNLSSEVLGGFKSHNAMRIKLDNVYADTEKDKLPFIIFNWNGWQEANWTDANIKMTFVDGNNKVIDKATNPNFYKKMGSHIIHNFPDLTGTLKLGQNVEDYPFAGTVLVPNGSIYLVGSSQTQNAYWGSLIAGNNITMEMPISKEKAFGSVFDTENLPDFDDMLLKLAFDKTEVTAENNTAANSLKVYGSGSDFTVAFSKDGKPITVTAKTDTDGKTDDQISGINLREDTPFTIDTTGWAPGKYEITGWVTSWKDSKGDVVENTDQDKPVAKFTIIVPEPSAILSLDAVPDLNFGSFTLGKSQAGTTSELKDFNVKNAQTFDGNTTGLIKVTDSRTHGDSLGGKWSLKISMTPFSSEENSEVINAQLNLNIQQENQEGLSSITVSSKEGAKSAFLLHNDGNEVSAMENFRLLTTADGKNSSSLELLDPVTSLGTYHSTVTWTLGDLPKSDEVVKDK